MAESDIEVGSTVRYVGFKRNVLHGAEGIVTKFLPPDRFGVSWGGSYARGELELVLPPKPSTEAPTLNSYDMVQDPDGTIWTVVRDSDEEVVELHNPLADRCHYALLRVVENWTRVGRLDASTEARFKRSHRCELASGTPTPSPAKTEPYNSELVGAVASAVRSDVEKLVTNESLNARVFDVLASSPKVPYTDAGVAIIENAIRTAIRAAESGPGIAALNLQAPPRPRRRHETTSWDPDIPLPDAEPGRYGWLP